MQISHSKQSIFKIQTLRSQSLYTGFWTSYGNSNLDISSQSQDHNHTVLEKELTIFTITLQYWLLQSHPRKLKKVNEHHYAMPRFSVEFTKISISITFQGEIIHHWFVAMLVEPSFFLRTQQCHILLFFPYHHKQQQLAPHHQTVKMLDARVHWWLLAQD